MDTEAKLNTLGEGAVYDVTEPHEAVQPRAGAEDQITRVATHGCVTRLLKVLMTNVCHNDCGYCAFRAGKDCRRSAFTPEELATTFEDLHHRDMVDGLFLSSGLGDRPVKAMDDMLAAVDIIRRHGYVGYVHLKILPGCEEAQVQRAAELGDRISINLEAPTEKHLARLSRAKNLRQDILQRMTWIKKAIQGKRTDSATQFVVGGAGETDRHILASVSELYRHYGVTKSHYSAFNPIPGTPLEDVPRTSPVRRNRLYQADFLIRQYGIPLPELPIEEDGSLPQDEDPKYAMARRTLAEQPVEINRADARELLRVPGIGMISLKRILSARRQGIIREPDDLAKIGIRTKQAVPFLLLNGRRFATPPPRQMTLHL